jgi:hypothetical protein
MYEAPVAIAGRRQVRYVYAPIWDAEGIAFPLRPKFKLVTILQTTMRFYWNSHPDKA